MTKPNYKGRASDGVFLGDSLGSGGSIPRDDTLCYWDFMSHCFLVFVKSVQEHATLNNMRRIAIYLFLLFSVYQMVSSPVHAAEAGLYLDPHVAVGFNDAQGTSLLLGLDLGYGWTEKLAFGAGAYYSMGERPEHDREWGIGPFASYHEPILEFLVASVRQEINHVNLRNPVKTVTSSGTTYSHKSEEGIASVTTAGLHVSLTPNLGFSLGYRLVLGLTNSALDDGRSGVYLGFSIGL